MHRPYASLLLLCSPSHHCLSWRRPNKGMSGFLDRVKRVACLRLFSRQPYGRCRIIETGQVGKAEQSRASNNITHTPVPFHWQTRSASPTLALLPACAIGASRQTSCHRHLLPKEDRVVVVPCRSTCSAQSVPCHTLQRRQVGRYQPACRLIRDGICSGDPFLATSEQSFVILGYFNPEYNSSKCPSMLPSRSDVGFWNLFQRFLDGAVQDNSSDYYRVQQPAASGL